MSFRVRGFAGAHHPRGARFGTLLLETTHRTESSAAVEVEAWQSRMTKRPGEVSHAELIDCRIGGSLTEMNIRPETVIPWSWRAP